jgi:4-aminobutyrate aminotransferase/(S)-3-amino-2-methylpropionate transaminase
MARAADALPLLRTEVPGPHSIALGERLARVESRNITTLDPRPIFWQEAWRANVADVDGNVFIDLTSGFGVAFAGHSNPRVAEALGRQAAVLPHALGDVYPAAAKVALLEKLASIAPGELGISILGSDGADAVEAALKTAALHTGRPGVLAFEGGYHGLTYGALAATWRSDFRGPFLQQLNPHVRFAPYPAGDPDAVPGSLEQTRQHVLAQLDAADRDGFPIGAVIVEPILGRGGLIVPPRDFLPWLRDLCDGRSRVLIFDEVYTGMGRTGAWFACDHAGVVPDIMAVGKALTGSIPLSAAIGTPSVMAAWPPSTGEAIHTSTFLGNPAACAAALAQIDEIDAGGLLARGRELGTLIEARTAGWVSTKKVQARRGLGLLQGVRLHAPAAGLTAALRALEAGVIVMAEGDGSVLAITPPACITEIQLEAALDILESAIG